MYIVFCLMLRFNILSLIACLMMKFQYLRNASLNVLQLFHQYSHFIRNFYNAINQKLTQNIIENVYIL